MSPAPVPPDGENPPDDVARAILDRLAEAGYVLHGWDDAGSYPRAMARELATLGFAAGRAAASPDPTLSIDYIENQIRDIAEYVLTDDSPEDPAPESQIAFAKKYADEIARFWASHRDATIHDDPPAASPDERLREAGDRLARLISKEVDESGREWYDLCAGWRETEDALGAWAALAAADREAPDEETHDGDR